MNQYINYLSILSGILTVLIACITLLIYYQFLKVEKNSLKLNIYDKRFKILQAVKEIFQSVSYNDGVLTFEEVQNFSKQVTGYSYLFDVEVSFFINQIEINIRNFYFIQLINEHGIDNVNINKINKDRIINENITKESLINWFRDNFIGLDERFEKYFSFKKFY